jgi:hypothetical protein
MDAFPKAKADAQQALALDDTLVKAHVALGLARLVFDWDFAGAELEARRALELGSGVCMGALPAESLVPGAGGM